MLAGTIGVVVRSLAVVAGVSACAAIAGCGSDTKHIPKLADLPLAGGTRIVAQSLKCDKGANAFCGIEFVVVGPRYRSSNQLLLSEHRRLKSAGWTGANADIAGERAADSPGHKLHLTFATGDTDLRGTELGWIKRTRTIQVSLSRQMFARVPALSMFLEEGSG
jgi:hypothetical protein